MNLEENIFLDKDTAIPLGIIVNELVSNSLKHAFNGRDNGIIRIRLYREESKNIKTIEQKAIMTIRRVPILVLQYQIMG